MTLEFMPMSKVATLQAGVDSDAVFRVKESLVRQVPTVDDPARAAEAGLPNPFRSVHFDVTLLRADHAPLALEQPVGRQAR